MITNVIICLYGFREKCRVRNDILGHVTFCCIPSLIKCLFKSVVHTLVCVSLVVVLILAFVLEGIYVLMLAIDGACSGGQVRRGRSPWISSRARAFPGQLGRVELARPAFLPG